MGGIYKRGRKLWRWFLDVDGKRVFQPTGLNLGEEARARSVLEVIERRIEAEKNTGVPSGELTVKAYAERWLKGRPAQGVVTADDEARRLRLHAFPLVGDVLLKDLRPHHVRDMVRALRTKPSTRGGVLAPRTVRHVFGSLRTMLRDAEVDELISSNPCKLKRGELPPKIDKDREWRGQAIFTRGEVEALISDEPVPEDRRVWNALLFLTGVRFGEAAALRWRHLDAVVKPLGRLTIANSWNADAGDAGLEGSVKTEVPRLVPVHPTLAKVLAAWKLGGWQRYFGRPPEPDDLIAPNRNGDHRNPRRALVFFHSDCDALGLRQRRQHDARRTFTSLAIGDGARKDVVDWVTHAPGSSMIDLYTTLPWEVLCTEVAKLKLELRDGAKLLDLPVRRAAGAGACDSPCDSRSADKKKPPSLASLEAISSARSRGLEGGKGTREDLRRPARTEAHRDVASSRDEPHRPSPEGAVTERVTVPVDVLRELADLARRADPRHPALIELERYIAGS